MLDSPGLTIHERQAPAGEGQGQERITLALWTRGESHVGVGTFPVLISPFNHAAKAVTNLTSSCLLTGSPTLFSILVNLSAIKLWAQGPKFLPLQVTRPCKACCPGILRAGLHVLSGRCPGNDVEGGGGEEFVLGFACKQTGDRGGRGRREWRRQSAPFGPVPTG